MFVFPGLFWLGNISTFSYKSCNRLLGQTSVDSHNVKFRFSFFSSFPSCRLPRSWNSVRKQPSTSTTFVTATDRLRNSVQFFSSSSPRCRESTRCTSTRSTLTSTCSICRWGRVYPTPSCWGGCRISWTLSASTCTITRVQVGWIAPPPIQTPGQYWNT